MAKARKRTTRADSGDTLSFGAHDEDVGQNLIELYDTYLKLLSSRTHSKLMTTRSLLESRALCQTLRAAPVHTRAGPSTQCENRVIAVHGWSEARCPDCV